MTASLWIAAGVVIAIALFVIVAVARAVGRELDHTDDWWQPSEAGKLAKERFDAKQAAKEQKETLRRINKPKYQQPLNQPTENS